MLPRLVPIACISVCTWMNAPAAAQTAPSISLAAATHGALAGREAGRSHDEPVAELDRGQDGAVLAMYLATIATQMLDVHSTLHAVERGAVDANPVVRGLVGNPAAFVSVKAAVGVGVAYATHRIARRNRTAGIVASIAINSACLMIAAHNYRAAPGNR